MKFLPIGVYTTPDFQACSLGGVSSNRQLYVACPEGVYTREELEEDYSTEKAFMEVRKRNIFGNLVYDLVEIGEPRMGQWGGSFGYSTDSRFARLVSKAPLKIMDRFET